LLITGANGKLGRATVEYLLSSGAQNVVAGTRDTSLVSDIVSRGATARRVDFHDPASLAASFDKVDRGLIISLDARQGSAEERARGQLAAVRAAALAELSLIVYTSMHSPEPGARLAAAATHYQTEQAIEQTDISYSILRVNSYADNVFWWLPPILASRRWVTASGGGRTAYVDRLDVARVAVAALKSAEGLGRINLSGPEALAAADVVAIVEDVFNITVELIQVDEEERERTLMSAGVTASVAQNLVAFEATTRAGAFDTAGDVVAQLTGSKPRTFYNFLVAHRAALLAAARG
jgi:NAD(P)H dehydrogenase (quinone)